MEFALSVLDHLGQIYLRYKFQNTHYSKKPSTSLLIVEILLSNRYVRILSNIKMVEDNRKTQKLHKIQNNTGKTFY